MKKRLIAALVAGIAAGAGANVIFSTTFETATQPGGQGTPINHGGTVSNGFAVSQFTRGAGLIAFKLEATAIPTDIFIRDSVGTNPASNLVQAVAANAYIEFTVTADQPADFGNLAFKLRGFGSALTGYITARSSVDNYTANLVTVSGAMNNEYPAAASLSDAGGFEGLTNVTFRFYVYDLYAGQNNRYLGIDDIELSLATPPPPPVYGTILVDDFSAGKGDWATRSNSPTNVVFTNGVVRISPNPNNGQPGSAYLGFDTVTLLDGETLRMSADVATDYAEPKLRDLRIALGLANPAIAGDSTVLAVPMDGYLATMPSGGSTTNSRVSWIDAAGGTINFFNASTALVGDIPLGESVSATNTLKTWVLEITRSDSNLVFTGSFDGTAFGGSATATGAAVIANFKFNTLGLGYAYATGQIATFDNVKLERFAAAGPTGFAAWADGYDLAGNDALAGANPDDDLLDNLYEYALGGNPTNGNDIGHIPEYALVPSGGTNWLEYVHARRKAADDIAYFLELTTDLVYGTWTNAGYAVVGTGDIDAEFESVTNRVSTAAEAKQFIRLVVEETP